MSKLIYLNILDLRLFRNLISDIGAVEAKKHELLHAFAEVVSESKKLNEELEEKYGKITVNLEDGSYEEIKEEDGQAD